MVILFRPFNVGFNCFELKPFCDAAKISTSGILSEKSLPPETQKIPLYTFLTSFSHRSHFTCFAIVTSRYSNWFLIVQFCLKAWYHEMQRLMFRNMHWMNCNRSLPNDQGVNPTSAKKPVYRIMNKCKGWLYELYWFKTVLTNQKHGLNHLKITLFLVLFFKLKNNTCSLKLCAECFVGPCN